MLSFDNPEPQGIEELAQEAASQGVESQHEPKEPPQTEEGFTKPKFDNSAAGLLKAKREEVSRRQASEAQVATLKSELEALKQRIEQPQPQFDISTLNDEFSNKFSDSPIQAIAELVQTLAGNQLEPLKKELGTLNSWKAEQEEYRQQRMLEKEKQSAYSAVDNYFQNEGFAPVLAAQVQNLKDLPPEHQKEIKEVHQEVREKAAEWLHESALAAKSMSESDKAELTTQLQAALNGLSQEADNYIKSILPDSQTPPKNIRQQLGSGQTVSAKQEPTAYTRLRFQ